MLVIFIDFMIGLPHASLLLYLVYCYKLTWIYLGVPTTDYRHECVVKKKNHSWDRSILWMYAGLRHLIKNVLESTSYILPLASKTSFTDCYAEPSRALTFIGLLCAILACSKVGTWDKNLVIEMNSWITNFLLSLIFSHNMKRWCSRSKTVGLS